MRSEPELLSRFSAGPGEIGWSVWGRTSEELYRRGLIPLSKRLAAKRLCAAVVSSFTPDEKKLSSKLRDAEAQKNRTLEQRSAYQEYKESHRSLYNEASKRYYLNNRSAVIKRVGEWVRKVDKEKLNEKRRARYANLNAVGRARLNAERRTKRLLNRDAAVEAERARQLPKRELYNANRRAKYKASSEEDYNKRREREKAYYARNRDRCIKRAKERVTRNTEELKNGN